MMSDGGLLLQCCHWLGAEVMMQGCGKTQIRDLSLSWHEIHFEMEI